MSPERTFVDEYRFLFTSDVQDDEARTFIAVQWTGLSFTPDESFLRPLREYLRPRHEIAEVWLVYPEDLSPLYERLRELERFPTHDEGGVPRLYRFFAVDKVGALTEQSQLAGPTVRITDEVADGVLNDGLRQLFSDTGSLAEASAGFHFTHPGGAHSKYFIRASQAASRQQHAHYVAMALSRTIPVTPDTTVWVDTAGISTVGYALGELQRRLGGVRDYRVETFGGHDGVSGRLRPVAGDIVLVSGSTSGSLARKVIAQKNVEPSHVATLFYLGEEETSAGDGIVLCDLTLRSDVPSPSMRDSHLKPYKTTKNVDECGFCLAGSASIELQGDSFFPAARTLDLRMPTLLDRPLDGKTGPRADVLQFDGSDYFEDLYGYDAITYDPGTAVDKASHGVSTRIEHLFGSSPNSRAVTRIAERLDEIRADTSLPVTVVLSLRDEGSVALGQFVADRVFGEGAAPAPRDPDAQWRAWYANGTGDLDESAPGGTVLVCAGVVGSGRLMTAASRELRKVKGDFDTRYFIGAAHPESSTTLETLVKTLRRKSGTTTSKLDMVWRIPREPRFPGSPTPWTRELSVLNAVVAGLDDHPEQESVIRALEPRLLQLEKPDSRTLFVGSLSTGTDVAMATINPMFALWTFDWHTDSRTTEEGATPTHAEIYSTVAHLLYESRHHSPSLDSPVITVRRHGYALNPAVFDRFNDPVIQAAILRAAEPGELHYGSDSDASRAIADVLSFIVQHHRVEAGNAAYEFLLALAEGTQDAHSYGLRIDAASLARVLNDARGLYGQKFEQLQDTAPRVWALLLFLATVR